MSYCGLSCAIPSYASAPVGFGSPYRFGCGYGLGYSGLGYCSPYYSSGASASGLGIVPGVNPACVSQLPSSEIMIQPPPAVLTIPGPMLSASCEPVAVGGNTACAVGGYGLGGYGQSRYGLGGYGRSLCWPGYLRRRRYYRYPC